MLCTYVPSSSSPSPPIKQTKGLFRFFNILLIDKAVPIDAAATVIFELIMLLGNRKNNAEDRKRNEEQ